MKNRTLIALLVVVAILATGGLVVLADGQSGLGDWLMSLHGGH